MLNFLDENSIQYKKNQKMSEYTTMKVGGYVDIMCFPKDISEMSLLLSHIKKEKCFILGKGSNLIVNDEGLDVVVINTEQLKNIYLKEDTLIFAEAGVSLEELSMFAMEHSLTGLEFASGIPGTVGGAVFMNAGAYDGEIKDVLEESIIFTDKDMVLNNKDHEFSYRKSSISKNNAVVLGSSFRLQKGDKEDIKAKMIDLNQQRASKQPLDMPSAGSTFKRPEGFFAGKLITDAGLKDFQCGGASVSTKHAGFVVNHDNATAQDILDLIAHVQNVVEKKFNVRLEPEIKFLEKNGTFRKFV